ncbi:MAG: CHAT domain-containing protein [Chloroflexota bacterium]
MSNATIISFETLVDIHNDEEQQVIFKVVQPNEFGGVQQAFEYQKETMPLWGSNEESVSEYGKLLRESLLRHEAVKQAFKKMLLPSNEIRPLFLYIDSDEAEQLYWETLVDEQDEFLALNPNWPIARFARSAFTEIGDIDEDKKITLILPLRLFACLSGVGLDPKPEWLQLRAAILRAQAEGLSIEAKVYVSNVDLFIEIDAEIKSGHLVGIEVALIKDNSSELLREMRKYKPHIIHFFCHGTVVHEPRLEIAPTTDAMEDGGRASITVIVEALIRACRASKTWLVILNCCHGANTTELNLDDAESNNNLQSMVRKLVANGVPAAIGMLDTIDVNDAHVFCAGLYASLFDKLVEVVTETPDGQLAELRFEETLLAGRTNIAERYRNGNGRQSDKRQHQWALPSLYLRHEQFYFAIQQKDGSQPIIGIDNQSPKDISIKPAIEPDNDSDREVLRFLRMARPDLPIEIRKRILEILTIKPDTPGALFGEL